MAKNALLHVPTEGDNPTSIHQANHNPLYHTEHAHDTKRTPPFPSLPFPLLNTRYRSIDTILQSPSLNTVYRSNNARPPGKKMNSAPGTTNKTTFHFRVRRQSNTTTQQGRYKKTQENKYQHKLHLSSRSAIARQNAYLDGTAADSPPPIHQRKHTYPLTTRNTNSFVQPKTHTHLPPSTDA